MYKKRPGTSGVLGHFYESKLLSLILFRAQNDCNIEEFYLASNMDEIGAFDDVFLKLKIKGHSQPLFVFIQVKHRENDDRMLNLNSKEDLVKYFKSYLAIMDKFSTDSQDNIFNEQFQKSECMFVIYTNEKGDVNNLMIENTFIDHLTDLIGTGPTGGSQPLFTNEYVLYLSRLHTAAMLAKRFAKFLYTKNNQYMMNDEFISLYHVLLAQNVVVVFETQQEGSFCKFRNDFFTNSDKFLVMFRDELYDEVLKIQKFKDKKLQEAQLCQFISEPSLFTLSHVIGTVIVYKNGKFEPVVDVPANLRGKLDGINFPQSSVNETIELAAINILKSSEFIVPPAFGNTDLKLRGNPANVEKRLNYLTRTLIDLMEKSKPSYVVTLNESVSDGLLRLNGGLGSAVGNLFVYDDHTKFIKFTDNGTLLKAYARNLFDKLKSKIDNLHEYYFDVKYKKFPKLSFDCFEESLARDFLSKLVFYTSQADQTHVEKTLEREIEIHQRRSRKTWVPSDVLFLKFHDKVQKWWISEKKVDLVPYFTKSSDVYQQAVNDVVKYPQISSINTEYMYEISKHAINIQFSENTMNTMKSLNVLPRSIIVTDVIRLTSMKIIQYLQYHEHIILNFIPGVFMELLTELTQVIQEAIIVIICERIEEYLMFGFKEKCNALSHVINNKNLIIITQKSYVEKFKKYFPGINNTFCDEIQFPDLNLESQKNTLKKAKVIFQGQDIGLGGLMNNVPSQLIEGPMLERMILQGTIVIGEPLINLEYDKIKHLYVDRRVSRDTMSIELRTLLDINDDVVVITAESGMGKSTLLTHLSLATKALERKFWVVRINLIEYSKNFMQWQKDKTDLNILKTLQFVCEVIFKTVCSLFENNNEVYLQDLKYKEDMDLHLNCVLKLFLCFFNSGNMIFLFDGFDEICPDYKNTVIALIKTFKNDIRKNKIWVVSRSYSEIQTDLEINFSAPYTLEPFTVEQLNSYLDLFWKTNLVFDECEDELINRIRHFLEKISPDNIIRTATLSQTLGRVHVSFILYLITNLSQQDGADKWSHLNRIINFLRHTSKREDIGEASTATTGDTLEMEGPLLTYLTADYFVNFTKRLDKLKISSISFDIDVSTVYNGFIESIVQKHYEDKWKTSIYNPAISSAFKKSVAKYFRTLKNIAAYNIFHHYIHEIFDEKVLVKLRRVIRELETGKQKIGIICGVINGMPQFVHKGFSDYLAVEYLFDLMMTINHERRDELTQILSHPIATLCVWINQKLAKEDFKEFRVYFTEKEDIVVPFPVI